MASTNLFPEPKLTIEGDEMFKAFEYAQLYINNHFVSTEVLPKLGNYDNF
jgi:hypothetical protein